MADSDVRRTAMQKQPEEPKKPFARPKVKGPRRIPQPKFISKTETPLTNDPLWKESFVLDGETGPTSSEPARELNANAAGYLSLIDAEYNAISDVDRYYSKSISNSAHAYFHGMLYWYELALMSQKRGTSTQDQERLIRFVEGYTTAQIASGAGEYLEGLGDYTDQTGVKHLLVARQPNHAGDFGRLTANTHGLYETLPAPHILYERVLQDLHRYDKSGILNFGAMSDGEIQLPVLIRTIP